MKIQKITESSMVSIVGRCQLMLQLFKKAVSNPKTIKVAFETFNYFLS